MKSLPRWQKSRSRTELFRFYNFYNHEGVRNERNSPNGKGRTSATHSVRYTPPPHSGRIYAHAQALGAFWAFPYAIARQRKVIPPHAKLKSKLHSDGFFVSKILLEQGDMRDIIAHQMIMRMRESSIPKPDFVAGIPDGATKLGTKIAQILNVREAHIAKENGRIVFNSEIPPDMSLLLVEDFCTKGTGFTEAVLEIKSKQPAVKFLLYELVILNRGDLKIIPIEGAGDFLIVAVIEQRIKDWNPNSCKLCDEFDSEAIPPKKTDENWRRITTPEFWS